MAKKQTEDVCSFCGRRRSEVKILISGVDGHICENCVVQADEIIKEEVRSAKPNHGEVQLQKPLDIKQLLDDYVAHQKNIHKFCLHIF